MVRIRPGGIHDDHRTVVLSQSIYGSPPYYRIFAVHEVAGGGIRIGRLGPRAVPGAPVPYPATG
jgi:hypothetical protein